MPTASSFSSTLISLPLISERASDLVDVTDQEPHEISLTDNVSCDPLYISKSSSNVLAFHKR